MPLEKSGSRAAIGQNIREMSKTHPHAQAIAAALSTADRYGKRLAAGGSSGATPVAPTAPTYATAPSGVLPSGLMSVPQTGNYTLDPSTGALSAGTQAALQGYAQRGLPIAGTASAAPAAAAPTPADLAAEFWSGNGGGEGGGEGGGGSRRGGRIGRFAAGGVPTASEMAPWFVRSEAHGMDHPAGLVNTAGAGRTDNVPMSVAGGSHVLPGDIISGLGQGNTLAGAHAMTVATSSGPGGISLPRGPSHSTIPKPPSLPKFARGGGVEWEGHPIKIATGNVPPEHGGVKCVVAGGEWILSPDEVQRVTYQGKKGHDAIDAWILDRRRDTIKKMKALPGPIR